MGLVPHLKRPRELEANLAWILKARKPFRPPHVVNPTPDTRTDRPFGSLPAAQRVRDATLRLEERPKRSESERYVLPSTDSGNAKPRPGEETYKNPMPKRRLKDGRDLCNWPDQPLEVTASTVAPSRKHTGISSYFFPKLPSLVTTHSYSNDIPIPRYRTGCIFPLISIMSDGWPWKSSDDNCNLSPSSCARPSLVI